MEIGKALIELAAHIPMRNIRFYLDSHQAMSAVNQKIRNSFSNTDLQKIKDPIFERGLEARPQEAIAMLLAENNTLSGKKAVGKLILSNLRLGRFNKKGGPFSKLPETFLLYGAAQDLQLRGLGPRYSLIERFIDCLAHQGTGVSGDRCLDVRGRLANYIHEDMAAVFLGYTLLNFSHEMSGPIVPFPSHKTGFIDRLFRDVKKLCPHLFHQHLHVFFTSNAGAQIQKKKLEIPRKSISGVLPQKPLFQRRYAICR
jgi:hypothetical protein